MSRLLIDINSFKGELNFMKATWSENFHSQINETQSTVRNLCKDYDTIQSLAHNMVVKRDMYEVYKKLEKMVSVDTFTNLEKMFESNAYVKRDEFDTFTEIFNTSQKHIEKLYTREEFYQRLN